MANTKITGLTAIGSLAAEDVFEVVDDPSGTPASRKATLTQLLALVLSDATPEALGAAAAGTSTAASRSDHVHAAAVQPCEIGVACSDESTAIDSTGTKVTFRMPYAMTVTDVRASLTGATTTGTVTVDINEGATSILSTKLTIDATETTSETAATAAVISDSALADDAEITVDVDAVGDSTATGLKVWIIGTRT